MTVPFRLITILNSHNMAGYLDVENMMVGWGETSGMILTDLPPLTPVAYGLLGITGG